MASFNLEQFNTSASDYLGVATWWTVNNGLRTVEQVEQALVSSGLSEEFLRKPTAKSAFIRASKHVTRENGSKFSRKIRDTSDLAVIGIVNETKYAENLSYRQTTTAKLNKETGKMEVFSNSEQEKEEIENLFSRYTGNVTDSDIRSIIVKIVRSIKGIALRESGGIYFVPRENVSEIVKVDNFLHALNIGKMYFMHVANIEGEREITWEAAKNEVEKQIEAVLTASEKFNRESALEKQFDNIDEIQAMTDAYIKLTGIEEVAEEIAEKLQMAEAKLTERIAFVKQNRMEKLEEAKALKIAEKIAEKEKLIVGEQNVLF